MARIKPRYKMGSIVYLKTDPDQRPMMITGIMERPSILIYYISFNGDEFRAYDIEISQTKDTLKTLL